MSEIIALDTELRKLKPAELYTLGQILNVSDSWKKLMAIVPKGDTSNYPKFNTEHFSMIEQAAQQQRRNAAEIFLSEWGTMGKNRPTLRILLKLLVKAELFRAADYVAEHILREELPKRPKCGPAAPVDISDEVIKKLLEDKEEFENFGINESVVFALSSNTNDNQVINLSATNNKQSNCLERNMQSTKLVSTKEKYNEQAAENIDGIPKAQMSDLMKFSSGQNVAGYKAQVFEKQEISSCELPIFINEFGPPVKHANTNHEVLTEDLPVFLNDNVTASQNVSSDDNHIDILMGLPNLNINANEMNSIELPASIVEFGANVTCNSSSHQNIENNSNTRQSVLVSQELPISVLEYNK